MRNHSLTIKVFLVPVIMMASLCGAKPTFDATDVHTSTIKIKQSLPKEKHKDFDQALFYFTLGGSEGEINKVTVAVLKREYGANEIELINQNQKQLHGLTGQQILERYYQQKKQAQKDSATDKNTKTDTGQ